MKEVSFLSAKFLITLLAMFNIGISAYADNECGIIPSSGGVVICDSTVNNIISTTGITYDNISNDVSLYHNSSSDAEFINISATNNNPQLYIENEGIIDSDVNAISATGFDKVVVVNNGNIETQYYGYSAIIGHDNSNVNILNNGNITSNHIGIKTYNNAGNTHIVNNGNIETEGAAILASGTQNSDVINIVNNGNIETENALTAMGINVSGFDFVKIENNGLIETDSNTGRGIEQSNGRSVAITNSSDGRIITNDVYSHGIVSKANYKTKIVNEGGIYLYGDNSDGIYSYDNEHSGIINDGNIHTYGNNSHGIYVKNDTNSTIENYGVISTNGQDSHGIMIKYTNDSVVNIENHGIIDSENANSIEISGQASNEINIDNHGVLTSSIDVSSYGANGSVVFTNGSEGMLQMDNNDSYLMGSEQASFYNDDGAVIENKNGEYAINIYSANSDSKFINRGEIDMQNKKIHDQLTINADEIVFDTSSITRLDTANISINSSDSLVLNGNNVSGKSYLKINGINLYPKNQVDTILVVDINATNSNTATFSSNYVDMGAYEYQLFDGADISQTAGDWYLHIVGKSRSLYGNLALAYDSSDLIDMFNNNVPSTDFADGKNIKSWARILGGKNTNNSNNISHNTNVSGTQFGIDIKLSDSVKLGFSAGDATASANGYDLKALETEVNAQIAGVSAEYQAPNSPIKIAASASYGNLEANNHVNDGCYMNDTFKGKAFAAQVSAGYEIQAGNAWSVEPRIGASHSNISFDEYTNSAGAKVAIDDSNTTELATSIQFNGQPLSGVNMYVAPKISTIISGGDYKLQADHETISVKGDDYSYGAKAGVELNLSKLTKKVLNLEGTTSFDVDYQTSKQHENISASANLGFKF